MKVELYRLVWNLTTEEYTKNIHKLSAKETDKTYKDIEGSSGYISVLNKSRLGEIGSGIWKAERLSGFTYEVFCLEKDIEHFKKELDLKIRESLLKHYSNFKQMKQKL